MNELQVLLTGWPSGLVAALRVGCAFGAGMVAALNPCRVAMLPAYLPLHHGAPEDDFV